MIDNLKAGVIQADWFNPELNPKLLEFCTYCGTNLMPTKPAMSRHKGKVERGVDYVQDIRVQRLMKARREMSNALTGERASALVGGVGDFMQ